MKDKPETRIQCRNAPGTPRHPTSATKDSVGVKHREGHGTCENRYKARDRGDLDSNTTKIEIRGVGGKWVLLRINVQSRLESVVKGSSRGVVGDCGAEVDVAGEERVPGSRPNGDGSMDGRLGGRGSMDGRLGGHPGHSSPRRDKEEGVCGSCPRATRRPHTLDRSGPVLLKAKIGLRQSAVGPKFGSTFFYLKIFSTVKTDFSTLHKDCKVRSLFPEREDHPHT